MKNFKIIAAIFILSFLLNTITGCRTIPKGIKPVTSFNLNKYLGTWHEIARINYYFERDLSNVTATYSLNKNGTIKIDNKGFNVKKNKWEEIIGKAKPLSNHHEGKLKVSFLGPFYSGYNVIAIDKEYKYALVAGKNTNYLWLLSREPTMPESVRGGFVKYARSLGYNVTRLVWN